MNKDVIIKTEKLSKSFSVGGKQQHVIKNLDMEIYNGDFTEHDHTRRQTGSIFFLV